MNSVVKSIFVLIICAFVILIIFIFYNNWQLNRKVELEIAKLTQHAKDAGSRLIFRDQLKELPEPVQRYFNYVFPDTIPEISLVQLKQSGFFRMNPEQDWLPIEAEQYFNVTQPEFIWYARLKMNPLLWVKARDKYLAGKGNMLIRMLSAITVGDVTGPELDTSALLRYLAEAPWFPTAMLPGNGLRWEPIDSISAKAVLQDGLHEVSAIFYFNESGEITRMTTDERFRTVGEQQVQTKWGGEFDNYKLVHGIKIPHSAEVYWHLPSGKFSYIKIQIKTIEYKSFTKQ